MNALDAISFCSLALDVLKGEGAGEAAQRKARKDSGENLPIELESMKAELRKEIDARFPRKTK